MRFRPSLILLVVLSLGVALTSPWEEPAGAATPWTVASTSVVKSSTTATITVTYRAPSAITGSYVLDTEIHNAANAKVAQWVETKTPTANQLYTFTYTWAPGALPKGAYTVGMGVWTSNWATKQTWTDATSTVNVPLTVASPTTTTTTPATTATTTTAIAAPITTTTTAPTTTPTTARPVTTTTAAPTSTQWRVASIAAVKTTSAATITVTYQAPAKITGTFVLDTEIHNPANAKVAQWVETKTPTANQLYTSTYTWAPGALPKGAYTVGMGVWTSNWATKQIWSDATSTVTLPLTLASPTTTTTTPTPTTTTSTTLPSTTTTAVPVTTTTTATTAPTTTTTTSTPPATTTTTMTAPPTTTTTTVLPPNPLAGDVFGGVNQNALDQAGAWAATDAGDAALMQSLANTSTAQWFGDWNTDVSADVNAFVSAADQSNRLPVVVAYDIVNRDCTGYSSGGAPDEATYDAWINSFASGIGAQRAVVIIEPDALAQMCGDTAARYRMMNYAVSALATHAGVAAYIDGGNAHWIDASVMAQRLTAAGVAKTAGFAVNVSNFFSTTESETYGEVVSAALGGAHYVVDTSRNGSGGNAGDWCNPTDATVGHAPTTATTGAHDDAYLWVDIVGNSDGPCNGGPPAGQWYATFALQLVAPWRSAD